MVISAVQKIKTGVFVIVAALLLLLVVFLIGKQKGIFADTFTVHANFKNIAGLKEGNFVRFAGINVGNVNYINIINDTTVQIQLTLQKRIQPYIKSNATASIGSDGLMGDKLIMIAPGTPGSPLVKDGGELLSANPMDMDKIMGHISKISENADNLTAGLAGVVDKINNGKGSLGKLLNSDELANKMEGTIKNANKTVASIRTTAGKVSENMEAAKHNILFRGYFRKKEKKRVQDSTERAKKEVPLKRER